jgi:hypothetical protein
VATAAGISRSGSASNWSAPLNTWNIPTASNTVPSGSTIGFRPPAGTRVCGSVPAAMAWFSCPIATNTFGAGYSSVPSLKFAIWLLCSTRSPVAAIASFIQRGWLH